ncbi:MAG: matrixin family metalloprotease [Gaiellaceae bacterium]
MSLWYDAAGDLTLVYTQDFPAGGDAPPGENTGPSELPEPVGALRSAGTQAKTGTQAKRGPHRSNVSCGANVSTWETYMLYPPATFSWYFNSGSTPAGLSVATTETYLRNAHSEWYNNSNWCGYADASVFSMAYGGTTTSGYGDNGINTVGFAGMSGSGCAIDAVGCTRVEVAGINVIESDTRLNSALYSWVNGQASGKYDTWSVMAHELGHTLGFYHVIDTSNVMNAGAFTNDTSPHLLGNGDANANNGKY